MAKTIISVDVNLPPEKQPVPLHNRWHPEIPPVVTVEPGEVFRVECLDWTGGQIKNDDSSDDVHCVDLTKVHYLSGPIGVREAEPGDALEVEILDIGTLKNSEWGFTGIFSRENGGGFLTEMYPKANKAIWDIHGVYATSRHIPGVRIPNFIHPGLIGTAPSHELLKTWNDRERALVATDPDRVPLLAALPNAQGALVGKLTGPTADRVAKEGARTIPPREHGGNCDIKNLTRGSKIYFPVYVKGANLSLGDLHFSQGDGEISFCGAIEMAGWIILRVNVIKNGMTKFAITNPIFETGSLTPQFDDYLIFEGISVDENGKQYYLDAHVAYRRAAINAIAYLKTLGYTGEQAYMLLSTVPVEGRISGIVDIPNACCTLALPVGVFNFDVRVGKGGKLKK